ncbi:MAG TPA: S-layer homology domain-containing protein [Candidatus Peribacteraceae bacterium]|nr:S-layer homology domain-containing protein [Candidatus Peribacteraceae bacterium]
MRSVLLKFSVPGFIALFAACYASPAFAIPIANYAYVTAFGSGTLDLATASHSSSVLSVSVDSDPSDIVIVGTGAYVVTYNAVDLVDIISNSVVKTITVGSAAKHIVRSGTGLYVTNSNDDTVSVIDINRNTVAKTISVGDGPNFIAASGTGVFVSDENGVNGSVSIIDTTTNTVDATITVGNNPEGIAVSGTGIYLDIYSSATVDVIDMNRLNVVKTITVGSHPIGIVMQDTGAFVTNFTDGTVSIIDTTKNIVDRTFSAGTHPYAIAFEGTGAYVTNENTNGTVTLIDTANYAIEKTINVSANPYGIAIRDVLTDPATIISPAASTTYTTPSSFPIHFFLPEPAQTSSVTLEFDDGGSTDVTITLSNTASGNFNMDLTDIASEPHVVSTTAASVPDGTYTVTLSYRDSLGNPVTSVSHAGVVIETPASSSSSSSSSSSAQSSSSSSTDLHTPSGGGSAIITPAYIRQVAEERFGPLMSSSAEASSFLSSSSAPFFTDVPSGAWFHASVMALQSQGVIGGYKDAHGNDLHRFGPADPVSFAELAKMIVLLTDKHFSIGAGAHWYDGYIAQAQKSGLTEYASATFNPNAPASREAVVRTILQAYGLSVTALPQSHFVDLSAGDPYAKDILTAVALNIISGDGNGRTVRPTAPVNRAELAKILADVSSRFVPARDASSSSSSSSVSSSASSSSIVSLFPAGADVRTVQTSILHVHADARIDSTVLWTARQGQEFQVLSIVANDWAHVRTSDGHEGYVWVHYVSDQK